MKILIRILAIFVLPLVILYSCDESESVLTGVEGGLVDIETPSVNYIVGNTGPYTASVRIYQGTAKTAKIDVVKTFYSSVNDSTFTETDTIVTPRVIMSNTTPYTTLSVNDLSTETYDSFSFTFDDLIADLTVEGEALPNSDGQFKIGDYWEFKYLATTDDGRVVQQNKTTKVTVATRFAGKYKAIDAVYGRNTGTIEWFYTEDDWPAETVIESVDAITYRVVEYFGPEAFDGNEWYFQVDPETLKISYPEEWDGVAQTGNDQPFITCLTNAGDFATMGLDCSETSNIVVLDDVEGKDRLYMTYGYYTKDSGPRTFYHVLEKIVE
ncbi:hypothetical protein ACUNWD_05780 [Sunxiuqinia sp. A32]|uniref:hypothetical protein n=1 Tax=Sunxiuqinia sp. A32 TaxID=3461496 RepID=UPI00404522AC